MRPLWRSSEEASADPRVGAPGSARYASASAEPGTAGCSFANTILSANYTRTRSRPTRPVREQPHRWFTRDGRVDAALIGGPTTLREPPWRSRAARGSSGCLKACGFRDADSSKRRAELICTPSARHRPGPHQARERTDGSSIGSQDRATRAPRGRGERRAQSLAMLFRQPNARRRRHIVRGHEHVVHSDLSSAHRVTLSPSLDRRY